MGLKRLWLTTIVSVLALYAVDPRLHGVWAQPGPMASCLPGYEWNRNSLGQDPCAITSFLECSCRGIAIYTIPPINGTEYYLGPLASNPEDLECECDSVMYNLFEACSTCQGAPNILSWMNWTSQCTTIYVAEFPYKIPPGTAIPRWAFYNVTALPDQKYNDTVASAIGRDPEATPSPLSTLSSHSSTKTSPPSTWSKSPPSSTPLPTPTSDSNNRIATGAIVGGVVGSVVPLIIVATIAALIIQRRRGASVQPLTRETSGYFGRQPTSPTSPTSPTFTTVSSHPPTRSAYHNTYGGRNQGQYSGGAEI